MEGTSVATGAVEAPQQRVGHVVQDGPSRSPEGTCVGKGRRLDAWTRWQPGPCLGAGASSCWEAGEEAPAGQGPGGPCVALSPVGSGGRLCFRPVACLFNEEQPPTLGTRQKGRWRLCVHPASRSSLVLFPAVFCGANHLRGR